MSRTELELRWRPMALADREALLEYIARDKVTAAIELDVIVNRVLPDAVEVLRVLHAAQQWQSQKKAK